MYPYKKESLRKFDSDKEAYNLTKSDVDFTAKPEDVEVHDVFLGNTDHQYMDSTNKLCSYDTEAIFAFAFTDEILLVYSYRIKFE